MELIQNRGYEIYIVGGLPRDNYLGITGTSETDYDVVTTATVQELTAILDKAGLKHYRVFGKKHQIVYIDGIELSPITPYTKIYPNSPYYQAKEKRKARYKEMQDYRKERCTYEEGHQETDCMLCDGTGEITVKTNKEQTLKRYVKGIFRYPTEKGTYLEVYVEAPNKVTYREFTSEGEQVGEGKMKTKKIYGVDYVRKPVSTEEYLINAKYLVAYNYNRPSYKITEDARRRDFTINTLYENADGEYFLLNPQARKDLQEGIIRFVESPKARIKEDPSRVIRALQLASRFGYRLASSTARAIKGNEEAMAKTPNEVIGKNVLKVMKQGDFRYFYHLLQQMKLTAQVFPALAKSTKEEMEEACKRMEEVKEAGGSLEEQWQALYANNTKLEMYQDTKHLVLGRTLD